MPPTLSLQEKFAAAKAAREANAATVAKAPAADSIEDAPDLDTTPAIVAPKPVRKPRVPKALPPPPPESEDVEDVVTLDEEADASVDVLVTSASHTVSTLRELVDRLASIDAQRDALAHERDAVLDSINEATADAR
jgi:hypothetical protein